MDTAKHNNYKIEEKYPVRNLNNVKGRRDAGEPNKMLTNSNKEISNNSLSKPHPYRIELTHIQADCGDSLINKVQNEQYKERTNKNTYMQTQKGLVNNKSICLGKNFYKISKTNAGILPEERCERINAQINKIVKQNIDLLNTNDNQISGKIENKLLRKTLTEEQEGEKRKPEECIPNNKKDLTSKDIAIPFNPRKNDTDAKKPKTVSPENKDKKNPKMVSLVVKLPKGVSNSKVQNNESVNSKNNKNVAQLHVPSKRISDLQNKTQKELNTANNHKQRKEQNHFQMSNWTQHVKAQLNDKNKNSQRSKNPMRDSNKKTKAPNIQVNSTKKGRNNISISMGKLVLQPNSHFERRKRRKEMMINSPDRTVRMVSPTTEVAKWAPDSIDKHTKQYYEAWVNTTLAAVSKGKTKILSKLPNGMQNFQQYLEAQIKNPIQDFKDKRFVGTIKVNHKRNV